MGELDDPYLNFEPPPEAPVFTPNEEEFADPLGYIAKIRPIAEKAGICKIKPPPDWQPPFAVDVDKFKFVPRIQRLNELEAKSRIKLNFLDQLAKFWDLQGNTLRIPHVEKKLLDLYSLYKTVEEEGGIEDITKERRWSKVAHKMGYPSGRGVGGILKGHYERLLYPYYLFKRGDSLEFALRSQPAFEEEDVFDKDYKPHGIAAKTAAGSYTRKPKKERMVKEDWQPPFEVDVDKLKFIPLIQRLNELEDPMIDYNQNNELKKLQFFGAGPKAAVPPVKDEKPDVKENPVEKKEPCERMKTREKTPVPYSYVDMYYCHVCGRGDGEEFMLLCDGCDDAFHTYCLLPPLPEIPKGDWRCPKCVLQACSKPLDPYGFEQSKREFTLQSFGEMADEFKANFFKMPVHMVPCEVVEKQFWRLVNSIEEDVCVQYGADIHAAENGSGFPTKQNQDLFPEDEVFPEDEEYINSGWNLNNLPVLEQSVLCHINADISGMKIPWCYVGMCFSSFCWHNEDHWSYSINYLHWGEPKTWYGVPGHEAEKFEEAMKSSAPELFENAPDLLHQLTTIMNPNILMKKGVTIVRTNQHAGEFIVTFPRAYHAGFNQGYNFAEAVNFCPADWLPMGRGCVEHYRSLHRQCVFSHEELVCKMAADPERLDFNIAATTHEDLLAIVEDERIRRKQLFDLGCTQAEREAFELLPDDERQCDFCKTTCFLSAVTCPCSPNKLVCVCHVRQLCSCDPHTMCLRYRYTLDELPFMLHRLKVRAESYTNWTKAVEAALDAEEEYKLELHDLKNLVTEAEEKHFPDSDLLTRLVNAVNEAEKCVNVANQLVSKKVRTRNRQSSEGKYVAKLSLDELRCFYEQVAGLPCKIKEGKLLKELLDKVLDFQTEAKNALEAETPDSQKLDHLIEFGITLDVDLPEIPKLKQVLQQAKWLDEVRDNLQDPNQVTLDTMRKLMESGVGLAPHPAVEKAMAELQELLTVSERWEEKARICLQARPRHVMPTLEAIVNEAKEIPAYLPNVAALSDALRKAKEWTQKVEGIQSSDSYPYLDILENLVNKGRPIPVRLDQLPQVESQVAAAKSWRERTARTFLKKNSTYTLLEVLSPRIDIGIYSNGKNKKKKHRDSTDKKDVEANGLPEFKMEEQRDPAQIVAQFKQLEQKEVESMLDLRIRNLEKIRSDTGDIKYCMCRKGASGFMLQCELCKDWFHGTCVPLPKSANFKNKSSQIAAIQAAKDLKFLCPLCLRSRRPRLETILSLLVSLQKLPVRLPEGEALQCLTERAMAWQDRARQALTTSELASALAKLSVLSQKMVEQAAREKTEKIINAELMKAANNPELQGHLASVSHSAFCGNQGLAPLRNMDSGIGLEMENSLSVPLSPLQHPDSESSNDVQMEIEVISSNHSGMSEHAYSSASKINSNSSPKKHQRKSPLVPRQVETPMLELSDTAKAQLEILMMEGDLLEVSLDETQHIWRILQACSPRTEDKFIEFDDSEGFLTKLGFEEKLKVKKDKDSEKKKKRKKIIEGFDFDKVKKIKSEPALEGERKKKIKPKIKKERSENIVDVVHGSLSSSTQSILTPVEKIKVKKVKKLDDKGDKQKKKKKLKIKIEGKDREKKREKKVKVKKEVLVMDNDDDDDDDEIDEDCAAMKCLKPTGEVNWVQCDRCEEWFHLLCVGLAEDEVTEDKDYECFRCKQGIEDFETFESKLVTKAPQDDASTSASFQNGKDITASDFGITVIKTEPVDPSDDSSGGGVSTIRVSRGGITKLSVQSKEKDQYKPILNTSMEVQTPSFFEEEDDEEEEEGEEDEEEEEDEFEEQQEYRSNLSLGDETRFDSQSQSLDIADTDMLAEVSHLTSELVASVVNNIADSTYVPHH